MNSAPRNTPIFVSEAQAQSLVTITDAISAVEEVFRSLHQGRAKLFPVVMAHGSLKGNRFGVKSGWLSRSNDAAPLVGLKVGTYWPANPMAGRPAHGSTTVLLDDETGALRAVVEASHLTALRTAAADAAATNCLARTDARRLAVVGAGHQAWFEILALSQIRPIDHIAIWSRSSRQAESLSERVQAQLGIQAASVDLQTAISHADIVVTVTSAAHAIFPADWVRPGTHVSAMGADASGKQELDTAILSRAKLFADVVEQSCTLGEFEAGIIAKEISPDSITPIGAVLCGEAAGRTNDQEITVFDSSGISLQDLAVAELALQKWRQSQE